MAIKMAYEFNLNYTNERLINDYSFRQSFPEVKSFFEESVMVESAYLNISRIEGDKDKLSFVLTVYKDDTKEIVVTSKYYTFTPNVSSETTPNFYVQAYEYLKTIQGFENAVDC